MHDHEPVKMRAFRTALFICPAWYTTIDRQRSTQRQSEAHVGADEDASVPQRVYQDRNEQVSAVHVEHSPEESSLSPEGFERFTKRFTILLITSSGAAAGGTCWRGGGGLGVEAWRRSPR